MKLIVYADFNCPFSALASHRLDLIEQRGLAEVEFRAVEHDKDMPPDGVAMVGKVRDDLAEEIETVMGAVVTADGDFELRIPEVRPNTATLCRSYATVPTADMRQELFRAVWSDGVAAGAITDEGTKRQEAWQREFESWEKQIVPSVVLEDGYVSRGLGGLKRLADLLAG